MTGATFPAAVFCLATGAALGCLFLLCKLARLLLGAGKWATALLDVAFCGVCALVVFLCALAVDRGRLRLFQAGLQGLGAWAAVQALDPFLTGAARGLRKTWCRVRGLLRGWAVFLVGLFPRPGPSRGRKGKKSGTKAKKAKKKT